MVIVNTITNGVSQEDYDAILKKLEKIETTLESHQQKLTLHEASFEKLRLQIAQLDVSMKAASATGKTSAQIVTEILKFKLGESSDGESVTLTNLVTFITNGDRLHDAELEQNVNDLSMQLTSMSDKQRKSLAHVRDEIHTLEESQKTLAEQLVDLKSRNIDVDYEAVKSAILPGLMSEIESKVKVSCETRNCPEPEVVPASPPSSIPAGLENLIQVALSKYDADKTGMPDLALEPAGGSILSTRCTRSSKLRNSVVSLWGFKIWSPPNNPRTIIQVIEVTLMFPSCLPLCIKL
jgi:hypothetical protein